MAYAMLGLLDGEGWSLDIREVIKEFEEGVVDRGHEVDGVIDDSAGVSSRKRREILEVD